MSPCRDRLRILVLDDSPLALDMATHALRAAGFEVRGVSSVAEFDLLLSEYNPDLILTDVQMPELSGDQICRVLKQFLQTKAIPVVLFSTLDETELAVLARRSGADGYVSKRGGPEQIVERIRKLTEEILF
ncbi:MAG: response regulator [Deltaproteobacteria bacterium]|nr:response regulator [Deltaproteobacteria bacterium]